MVLNNVTLIDGDKPVNVQVDGSKITAVSTAGLADDFQLNFDNALIFPGLINSHDHLDFNLFPQLGNRIYSSYTEWGKHIHETHKDEIDKVLKIPLSLREQWGIIKNLVCGVTTVVNHGEKLQTTDALITVHEQYYCLHSVQFEKKWKMKLNNPLKRKLPVVIHVGEGSDKAANQEIDQLIKWNLLQKTLVGIHAVAMNEKQAKKFKAIVWCPESNYFLLDKTAPVKKLKEHAPILFGTDSTLTSNWDIWDHISLAHKTEMLTERELYNSLNINPANTWNTSNKAIAANENADIVIAKKRDGKNGLGAFFNIEAKDILLVIHQGKIRLFDASLYDRLTSAGYAQFSKIYINGVCKYVEADVPNLMSNIRQYYSDVHFPISIN